MYYAHKLDAVTIEKIKRLPRNTLLSFDGVHISVYENFDVLVGRPVTLFVIGGFLDHPNYCDEQQLRWMKEMGATIGWHSWTHRTVLSDRDMERPKWCEPIFAYPFGIASEDNVAMVKRHGYNVAYATEGGNDQMYTQKRDPL